MNFIKGFLFLLSVFYFSSLNAQKFSIRNGGGNYFYIDYGNSIDIEVEGYNNSEIFAVCSMPERMYKTEWGNYTVDMENTMPGDSIRIDVIVRKNNKRHHIGGKTFYAKRYYRFKITPVGYNSVDSLTIKQFESLKYFTVRDSLGVNTDFKITKYTFFAIAARACDGYSDTINCDTINEKLKKYARRIGYRGHISFYNFIVTDKYGNRDTGSAIGLILLAHKTAHLKQFKNKNSYSIDDILKINKLEAFVINNDSTAEKTEYKVCDYLLTLSPIIGTPKQYKIKGDVLQRQIKRRIKNKMKPGDIIYLSANFILPDGTKDEKNVKIYIK